MRDAFPEFYARDEAEVARFITDAVIVPDANVLLGLYELSTPERADVLDALAKVEERLWLPYQAGLEYQRNRMGVVRRQYGAYQALAELHGIVELDEMERRLDRSGAPEPVKAAIRDALPALAEALVEAAASFRERVASLTEEHVVSPEIALGADPVRARLDGLFEGRVGHRPDPGARDKLIKEGLRRQKESIPPGFKDAGKDTDERRVGDYLLWAELCAHAAAETEAGSTTAFLFVTSDVKDDWFAKSGGRPAGPLPELVREFARFSPHGYHQVTLAGFLGLANRHLATQTPESTIKKTSQLSTTPILDSEALRAVVASGFDADAFREALLPRFDAEALREALLPRFDSEAFREAMTPSFRADLLRAAALPAWDADAFRRSLGANRTGRTALDATRAEPGVDVESELTGGGDDSPDMQLEPPPDDGGRPSEDDVR